MNKETIREFFNNFAPRWDNEPICNKEILDIILDNVEITENIDVLDVGCGTGVLFPYYLERNVRSITAVDLSPEMVKIAKSKFPQAEIICDDAESIVFNGQFDVVMIYNAFPHFPNPDSLIENLSKALKSGGRISIAHGMSKKELDEIHTKSAGKVSSILPECEELKKTLEPYFNVDIMISNDKMYQVTGTKK
ncbi:MAG: class I SAM-dependent methyltransferase [Clostridia bacterium]|nr:class I SAM-dependent methyltransferase [Clostridia bacterium]